MLALLPYDIQYRILQFQEPKEIIALYESCKELIIEETIKHTNFIVECKVVLSDEEIEWFESKKIKVKLLEEYKIDEYGQFWYKNGKCHRENDLPAIIYQTYQDEDQYWFKNGKLHREHDLPAVIHQDGHQSWYKNGKIHRDNDLPAEISSNGTQRWYKNGILHRDNDLPAIICSDGRQEWYKNGVKYTPI
jgi:antitoxin component YwqK of YwqJK toxin-antitoxin module